MNNARLEQLREEKDLTKKELAQILGVSSSIYSRWENGKDIIPTKRIYQIANYFEINIDYILGFTNKRTKIVSNDKINMKVFATRITEIRKDFGDTLREMANRLKMSNSTWSGYETGKFLLLGIFLNEICKTTNYSADWILGRTNEKYRD